MIFYKRKKALLCVLLINGLIMLAVGCGHEGSSKTETSDKTPAQIIKEYPKLGRLVKKKLEVQDVFKNMVKNYKNLNDINDVEQIKIFLKIGSGDQSIVKEYVVRKPNRAGLDWPIFTKEFFVKPIDSEMAMNIKDEPPISWMIFLKDTHGMFHMAFRSYELAGEGTDHGISSKDFEDYAKLKLENWPIKDTKQLDDQGDFIAY